MGPGLCGRRGVPEPGGTGESDPETNGPPDEPSEEVKEVQRRVSSEKVPPERTGRYTVTGEVERQEGLDIIIRGLVDNEGLYPVLIHK